MYMQHPTPNMFIRRLFEKKVSISIALLTLCLCIAGVIGALPHANVAHAVGTPTVTISPTASAYSYRDDQNPITVHGTHFGANETIKVYWNYKTSNKPGTLRSEERRVGKEGRSR